MKEQTENSNRIFSYRLVEGKGTVLHGYPDGLLYLVHVVEETGLEVPLIEVHYLDDGLTNYSAITTIIIKDEKLKKGGFITADSNKVEVLEEAEALITAVRMYMGIHLAKKLEGLQVIHSVDEPCGYNSSVGLKEFQLPDTKVTKHITAMVDDSIVVAAYGVKTDFVAYDLIVTEKPSLCVVADKVVVHEFIGEYLEKDISPEILGILFKLVTKDYTEQGCLTEAFLVNKIMEELHMGVRSLFRQYNSLKENILKVVDRWEKYLIGENLMGKLETRYEPDNIFKPTVVGTDKE